MNSEHELISRIYNQKAININNVIVEWWNHKVSNESSHDILERHTLDHVKGQVQKTMVSFGNLLKMFSEERLGHKTAIKTQIGSSVATRPIDSNPQTKDDPSIPRENSTEIAYFLQRVQSSMCTQVTGYERMAAQAVRSIQIRMKFIEDNLQQQRRMISDKTKQSKGVLVSPYTFCDILKLGELVDNQIQSRILMRNEIDEVVAILANEEYKVYGCFKDNMEAFQQTYPLKFGEGYAYGDILRELRGALTSKELYVLKYYVDRGLEELMSEQQVQIARQKYQEFKRDDKQTLERRINFAKVYHFFAEQIITKEWSLSIPYDFLNDQWIQCKGLITVNGKLILVNLDKQIVNEFELSKMEYNLQKAFVFKLTQNDGKSGFMKFFEGSKKQSQLIKFVSADEMEVFELYCKKWK